MDTNQETVVGPSQAQDSDEELVDGDGQTCPICLAPWGNPNSEHGLVSLKCGHLFGRSCITRWLESYSGRCPQCNTRTMLADIRNLYAKVVQVIDCKECDHNQCELQKVKEQTMEAQQEASQKKKLLQETIQDAIEERERWMRVIAEVQQELNKVRDSRAKALQDLLKEREERMRDCFTEIVHRKRNISQVHGTNGMPTTAHEAEPDHAETNKRDRQS